MNRKKSLVLSIVAVATLLVAVVGATFAYFTAAGGTGTSADVKVETSNQDILTFEVGDPINIEVTQTTFASGVGNKSGSTTAKAILKTANETNALKANYYLYLNISKNEFSYTTEDDTAELLLKVTDPSGNQVTSIDGLTYKTVTDGNNTSQSGFDITTKTGLITIANNKEITAQPQTTEEWKVEIIFVNLDEDQTDNAGKSLNAELLLQKEEYKIPTLADYIKSQYTSQGENGIYLHNSSLSNSAKDNSYRYAGANPNNYVCFGSTASTCPTDNLYRIIGVFGDQVKLIKYDYATSTALGTGGAYNSSAYSASDYSTYKGSLTSINRYYWTSSSNSSNVWSGSALNTTNLNGTYLTHLGTTWTNKIATTTWKVGGNTWANIGTSAMYTAYQNEIVSPAETTTVSAKIGLMYVSDYGYAASPTYWTYPGYSSSGSTSDYRAAINANWMYSGIPEWTISRMSNDSLIAFSVNSDGYVNYNGVYFYSGGVRPVFYLASSTTRASGSGSASDPIRLN